MPRKHAHPISRKQGATTRGSKRPSIRSRKASSRQTGPRYQDLTAREQARWHKAYQAVLEMTNDDISLSQAAKRHSTTPKTVLKYGADWLERHGRKWSPSDSFAERQGRVNRPEKVNILTENGTTEITISQAKTLSEYARYLNAVRGVLHGYPDAAEELAKFEGRTFTDAQGKKHDYITDRRLLSQLYDDGRISMEEFYAEAG